ncbi:MAG: Type 1 glutamine amidotransferase-like domain-containing protein, partial [Bacteroidetes bacterium]|nr:Type 1 glutamine amidotransferase-like domain-containing protein [Bacteroidota bacterium]
LADAYLNTLFHEELWNVLDRGGVVGGSSAGATILGSYLVRGDTKSNLIMMGDHEEGFGLFPNTAIDQHLLTMNRQFDLLEILEKHPDLLGIGIDENTAIIVTKNEFEVIGQSYVLVHLPNNQKTNDKNFILLKSGDRYDHKNRKILSLEDDRPLPFQKYE